MRHFQDFLIVASLAAFTVSCGSSTEPKAEDARNAVGNNRAVNPNEKTNALPTQAQPSLEDIHQLDCRMVQPTCQKLFFISSNLDLEMVDELQDKKITVRAKLSYSSDHLTSNFTLSLTDESSGRISNKSYVLHPNVAALEGIENFPAYDGQNYSVVCTLARFSAGTKITWPESCGP